MVIDELVADSETDTAVHEEPVEIGRGKSGRVFKLNIDGRAVARKVFTGHFIANLVNTATSGAPLAYRWNEDAAMTAYYRRRAESVLCDYWFDGKLRIAEPLGVSWNDEHKAYQLDTQFIEGRHAALHTPFSSKPELEELVNEILNPLQKHKIEAGLYAWQDGYGNPTAIGNFMLQETPEGNIWWKIDNESGGAAVPFQLFINPAKFFDYYLPLARRLKRNPMDDVEIEKLKAYVQEHAEGIEAKVGTYSYSNFLQDLEMLEHHQHRWKSLGRAESGIECALKLGKITEEQAEWYREHTNRWAMAIAGGLARKGIEALLVKAPRSAFSWVLSRDYIDALKKARKYASSLEYRTETARNFEEMRIRKWEERGNLSVEEGKSLREQLQSEKILGYLPDFGVHSAIFVASKVTYLTPALYALHLIDEGMGIAFISGGSAARFAYTAGRLAENAIKGKEKPYTALLLSWIHVIGNLAYPAQILRSGNDDEKKFAEFVITDFFTTIGSHIPIYGGKNTSTEHFFNRIPTYSKKTFNAIKYNHTFWSNAEAGAKILFSAYARA